METDFTVIVEAVLGKILGKSCCLLLRNWGLWTIVIQQDTKKSTVNDEIYEKWKNYTKQIRVTMEIVV